jgi:ubiquinone/menaquinone biosynthesis C-methylase UbiE
MAKEFMHSRSARIYDRMMHFYDWKTRYAKLRNVIKELLPEARTALECCCGTGRYLELFAQDFESTGFDIDPVMVEQCRARCTQSQVVVADMEDFDLGRQFDVVVCLCRSIAFTQTVARMRAVLIRMTRHLRSGGLLLVQPYFTPGQYWTDYPTLNTVEDSEGKIAWMYVSKRRGNLSDAETHYLVGDNEKVEHFTERHVLGLFTSDEYESALRDAGVEIIDRPELPADGVYLCRKV